MKKSNKLGLLALLCWVLAALLLAAALLIAILTVKSDTKTMAWLRIRNRSQQLIDQVQDFGPEAMADFSFGIWPEDESAHVGAVLVDGQGKVLGATRGPFQEMDACYLMVSPYTRQFTEFSYTWPDGSEGATGFDGRLALLTGEQGEIRRSFIARGVDTAFGQALPRYSDYFPQIDQGYYDMLSNNAGYDADDGVQRASQVAPAPAPPPDSAAVRAVEEYIAWEANQARKAGDWRLVVQPVIEGKLLITAYESDAVSQQGELEAWEADEWLWSLRPIMLPLFVAFTLATALWVFLDARRRGFKPALWGALVLVGSVIAWLVYMMVRPRRAWQNACPTCGYEPLKADFLACPLCGQSLKRSCPACGRALEPDWNTCPYCARKVE